MDLVLDGFLARQGRVLDEVSPACAPLAGAIAGLMRGGKRLRPAFCYWGWRGAGEPDSDAVVAAAASLELFQAAALIHDDLIDHSDTRRGMPAVHRSFAGLHGDSGWRGDADRFGVAGAVLAGDMCLVWADELLQGSGLPGARLAAARPVFDRMRTELLGGQYLDVLSQHLPEDDPAEALERARHVVRYKSAKYTVEHPLLMGAALAGAPAQLRAVYSTYGLALGEAFQLRDDVLGVFGDPQRTGKPAGDDLREGKRTVLIALTLQRAEPEQAGLVRRLLGDPGLDGADLAALRQVIVDTGTLDTVEHLIADLSTQARDAVRDGVRSGWLTTDAAAVLEALVTAATTRAR